MQRETDFYNDVLKLVIFDLDGVITDTAHYHYLAWKKIADELGITFDNQLNEKLKGLSRYDSLDIILDANHLKLSRYQKEDLITYKNKVYQLLLTELSEKDILEGIYLFILSLKQDGKKVAVGSSSRNANLILDKLNMTSLFDTIVTGCDVDQSKPHPDIFLKCATHLDIKPESCLVIEDAMSGIEAARRANMKSIGIGSESLNHATIRLACTKELSIDIIKSIL